MVDNFAECQAQPDLLTFGFGHNLKMTNDIKPKTETTTESLVGLDRKQLGEKLVSIGVPEKQIRMRVNQLWDWIYIRGVGSFDEMLNLSKDLRAKLSESFNVEHAEIVTEQVSTDGTRKWLLRFPSANGAPVEVETVYIPERDRGTLCVSSQVGCSLTCTFRHTGTQKMVRNLTAGEVLAQIRLARRQLCDFDGMEPDYDAIAPVDGRKVTNIVMMGMGEPLFNYDNVKQALLIALDQKGMGFSRRRITLSTSGVVPAIYKTGEEIRVMLAISLHATRDELRDVIVPINKKYPLRELLKACRAYPELANANRITFEYVMLKDINDSIRDARELTELLKGIPAKVNLIPFNPWPGTDYECSEWKTIERFSSYLEDRKIPAPIRTPRGRDILAACGQLKSESKKVVELKRDS